MKATFVRNMQDWNGDARLYKVEPPVSYEEGKTAGHVVVSAVNNDFACETYMFPAKESGDVLDWGELPGSQRGDVGHEEVLDGAGYEIVPAQA